MIKYKIVLYLLIHIFCVCSLHTQDCKYEAIVYIKPQYIKFNSYTDKPVNVSQIEIKSQKLSQLFFKYNVSTVNKAFPHHTENYVLNANGEKIYTIPFMDLYIIKINDYNKIHELIKALNSTPESGFAEWNYIDIRLYNDPEFTKQWYLHNTGQWGGINNIDINAPEAWNLIPQNHTYSINIGVTDGGVQISHIELDGKSSGDLPSPSNDFHGTHVAGIIGAYQNNTGINGIDKDAYIVSRQAANQIQLNVAAQKVISAVDYPCKIINASWGSSDNSVILASAFAYATKNNVLSVCAMGNGNNNSPHYPAEYSELIPSILGVGAINDQGVRAYYSNYANWIDLVAPGGSHCCGGPYDAHDIFSLNGNNTYSYRGATSFSAPIVSGGGFIVIKVCKL